MKKLLISLGVLLTLGLSSFTVNVSQDTSTYTAPEESYECNYGQCQATAKSTGNRCKHCVSNSGDRFCYQHK